MPAWNNPPTVRILPDDPFMFMVRLLVGFVSVPLPRLRSLEPLNVKVLVDPAIFMALVVARVTAAPLVLSIVAAALKVRFPVPRALLLLMFNVPAASMVLPP